MPVKPGEEGAVGAEGEAAAGEEDGEGADGLLGGGPKKRQKKKLLDPEQ